MAHTLSLGAINKHDGKYVYPKVASRRGEYVCPECGKDLVVVKGRIRAHHFRHKVDSVNPCNYYNRPTESQIHKDAKMLMKTLLENKIPIQFMRGCVSCKSCAEIALPEMSEESVISLEHRFDYNGGSKIADVAHTIGGEIKGIYEICHTHKTRAENRPEPWVEIDASSLLAAANAGGESLRINCARLEKCSECVEKDRKNAADLEVEKIKAAALEDEKKKAEDEKRNAASCRGECLTQCGCRGHGGYHPSGCCVPVECRNYKHCGEKHPQRYLDCHNGMDSGCAIRMGPHTYTNQVEKCRSCLDDKVMLILDCKHKVCNDCWWRITNNKHGHNRCPSCRELITWGRKKAS